MTSEPASDLQRGANPAIGRFWPNFVVAAVMTPLLWTLLEGLAQPDYVVAFYIISIGAIPISFAAVLLPGWRLIRGSANLAVRVGTLLLMLPATAILLWGVYCALWLALLLLRGEF